MDRSELERLFSATSLREPEDAVGFLLWRVAHRYQREIDRACARVGLTHLQFVVLVLIAWQSREAGAVTQSGLSAFSGIHPMQASTILKTLDEKRLVARGKSDEDERVKCAELTREGLEALTRALPDVEAAQRRFFGPDKAAGSGLHDALRRIVSSWREQEGS